MPESRQAMGQAARSANRGKGSFESLSNYAKQSDLVADNGRVDGKFMRKADKNVYRTLARQLRKDVSNPSNEYREGTREEINAQHKSTYRNLRAAFGMTTG